jgi:nucleosome-remodeling factor subunit BPTF
VMMMMMMMLLVTPRTVLCYQVWKQRGEEYRVTGQGGWVWISSTRVSRHVNARTLGLRLLAAKLLARKHG